MFYRSIYFSCRAEICTINSLERFTLIYTMSLPLEILPLQSKKVKSILTNWEAFWSPIEAMGGKRNLFWISQVLLETEFLAFSVLYWALLFHRTPRGLGGSQPQTESTQTRVPFCSNFSPRHLQSLRTRKSTVTNGKSQATRPAGGVSWGVGARVFLPSSLWLDQRTFWLTYGCIYQRTRSRTSQPHSSPSSPSAVERQACKLYSWQVESHGLRVSCRSG